jgi:hypothetical protein
MQWPSCRAEGHFVGLALAPACRCGVARACSRNHSCRGKHPHASSKSRSLPSLARSPGSLVHSPPAVRPCLPLDARQTCRRGIRCASTLAPEWPRIDSDLAPCKRAGSAAPASPLSTRSTPLVPAPSTVDSLGIAPLLSHSTGTTRAPGCARLRWSLESRPWRSIYI